MRFKIHLKVVKILNKYKDNKAILKACGDNSGGLSELIMIFAN
jgi:hypothetical protein